MGLCFQVTVSQTLRTSLFCVGMTTRSSSAGGSLPFVGGRPRLPHLCGNGGAAVS